MFYINTFVLYIIKFDISFIKQRCTRFAYSIVLNCTKFEPFCIQIPKFPTLLSLPFPKKMTYHH